MATGYKKKNEKTVKTGNEIDSSFYSVVNRMLETASEIVKIDKNLQQLSRMNVEIQDVWLSKHSRFAVIDVVLKNFDSKKKIMSVPYLLDRISNDLLGGTTVSDFKIKLQNNVDNILLRKNLNQEQIGDYFLISNKVPNIDDFWTIRGTVSDKVYKLVETKVLPSIVETLQDSNLLSESYGISLFNPKANIKKYGVFEEKSTFSIDCELKNKQLEPLYFKNITIPIDYYDYSDLFWLYEGETEFNSVEISNLEWDMIDAIDRIVKYGISLKIDDIRLELLNFQGLASKDKFIIDDDENKIQYNLVSLKNLYQEGALKNLVTNMVPLNAKENAVKFEIKNLNGQTSILFAGNNGISSPDLGIIYKPGDENFGSLLKARRKLLRVTGENEDLSIFLSAFDGRKNRSPLAGKKYKMKNYLD